MKNGRPSDIDIHVPGDPRGWEAPDHLRIYEWDKIMKVMKHLGYDLIDIHEHEFKKMDWVLNSEVSILYLILQEFRNRI